MGSGSSGNAYAFETQGHLFLVDAGFKAKVIIERLQMLGFSLFKPTTIFCTHTHQDHLLGVGELASHLDALVVGAPILLENLLDKFPQLRSWSIALDANYSLSEGGFSTFATSHDAPESLSYLLELEGIRFMVLTDTGVILPPMYRMAYYSHVLFLEANYNEELLQAGRYPPFLKRRISGRKGHLSNEQAVQFLQKIAHSPHLKQLFLCHLSKDNNRVELVRDEVAQAHAGRWQSHVCAHAQASAVYRGLA
nr:MBL fold metallo-hydrolase [Entomospira culicis]